MRTLISTITITAIIGFTACDNNNEKQQMAVNDFQNFVDSVHANASTIATDEWSALDTRFANLQRDARNLATGAETTVNENIANIEAKYADAKAKAITETTLFEAKADSAITALELWVNRTASKTEKAANNTADDIEKVAGESADWLEKNLDKLGDSVKVRYERIRRGINKDG